MKTASPSTRFFSPRLQFRQAGLAWSWLAAGLALLQAMAAAGVLERKVLCRQPGRYIGWPSIAQAANADLLVVFSGDRSEHVSPDGKIQMVRSTDGGKTWSKAVTIIDLPIDDRDVGIVRTREDVLVVNWFTGPPYGQFACVSRDEGKTWEVEREVRLSEAFDGDLGYPASCQLEDGTLWTVYYEIEKAGEKPCLMGTHWSLESIQP